MRNHHSTIGGVALALVLTLAGCSDDDTDPETEGTPTVTPTVTPTSASPTPKTPEEKAAAQLVAYLDVRDDALRAMKVNRKRLDKVAGGQEYVTIQQRVLEYASNNFSFKGEYSHTLGEPRDQGAYVQITDCEDESNVEFLTQKGGPVTRSLGGEPIPVTRSIEYTLKSMRGRWLVTSSTYALDGNQVRSC